MILILCIFLGILVLSSKTIVHVIKAHFKQKKTGKYDTSLAALPFAVIFGLLPFGTLLGLVFYAIYCLVV